MIIAFAWRAARVEPVDVLRGPGDSVREPMENADRLGYVIATAPTRSEAEQAAEAFIQAIEIQLRPEPPATSASASAPAPTGLAQAPEVLPLAS